MIEVFAQQVFDWIILKSVSEVLFHKKLFLQLSILERWDKSPLRCVHVLLLVFAFVATVALWVVQKFG